MLHLVDVAGLDRRDVVAVVDPEPAVGQLQHLGHEGAVGAVLVEVVLPGAHVVEARGHAAHGGGLALRHGVEVELLIDADMHVGIDAAGEGEEVLGVEDLVGLVRAQLRREPRDASVLDRDVEAIDRRLVRAHHARILDHEVVRLIHAAFPEVHCVSYRLPSATISGVPTSSLMPLKSSMRLRNGSFDPCAASEP